MLIHFNLVWSELDCTGTICVDLFNPIWACEGQLHFVRKGKNQFLQDMVIEFVVMGDLVSILFQEAVVYECLLRLSKCDDVTDEWYIQKHIPLKNNCTRRQIVQ